MVLGFKGPSEYFFSLANLRVRSSECQRVSGTELRLRLTSAIQHNNEKNELQLTGATRGQQPLNELGSAQWQFIAVLNIDKLPDPMTIRA